MLRDITEKKFKSALCRSSIAVPVIFAIAISYCETSLYFAEKKIVVPFSLLMGVYAAFSLLWLTVVPSGMNCRGNKFEIFVNLFPVELLLMAVFMQYHTAAAAVLLPIPVILTVILGILLRKNERSRGAVHNEKQHDIRLMRFFVTVAAIVFFVPGIMSMFVYNLEPLTYKPDAKAVAAQEQNADEPPAFLEKFSATEWAKCDNGERITLIQQLADYEAEKLGIPKVPVKSVKINSLIFGYYDDEKREIAVDLEHMQEGDAKSVAVTIIHETYHAYQYYLAKNIDFNSEISKTAYFDSARTWRDNAENYISGYEDIDGYLAQPLEKDAREYAEKEYESLRPIIDA